jgi:hypothetical protein
MQVIYIEMSLSFVRAHTRYSPTSLKIGFCGLEMLKQHAAHVAKPWTGLGKSKFWAPMRRRVPAILSTMSYTMVQIALI